MPLLFIETKDLGVSLDKIENSEQINRYFDYANLVLTDYLEFRFYRNGLKYCEPIKIADYDFNLRLIIPIPENFDLLAKTLADFPKSFKEPIKSGKHLSKIMGGKARILRDNIRQFYSLEMDSNTDLIKLYETLKKLLVHDLTINTFADMYAQTLVYGLFVARFYDDSLGSFSRQEARELIPNSNPFLKHFFDHIVGADFDKRLKYVVDELCEVFSHSDVKELMKEYFKNDLWGETHSGPDPVIHFYEDFLKEYDSDLRKKMGAYYTPQPVVSFIVNSVDLVLKKQFGLKHGLSDTSKIKDGVHKVQVLDPATGTGTFISAIIRKIYVDLLDRGQKGTWGSYVHNELLPRIFGFELMMAPYTIAHLKLGIAFRKTNFWDFHRRLGIYLTNSLEESTIQTDLFAFGLAESIAEESKEASVIKNERPIMVVLGNPPYSGESSNKNYHGHDVYKFESSGAKLQEKNSKWINDDYVKFIRFAENMVEKNNEGVVAMITAHGYIDNPTFRGMRYHLMKTFDEIYVLDLHGNSNKKEKALDGGKDENVFAIKTGVSIFIGIKKKEKQDGLAKIYKADVFGKQKSKFDYLNKNTIDTVDWKLITPTEPNFEWVEKDTELEKEYLKGFSVNDLFLTTSVGVVTARDAMSIKFTKYEIEKVVNDFLNLDSVTLRNKYKLGKDVRDWKVDWAKKDITRNYDQNKFVKISYRPFDNRWTFYTGNSRGFHCMPRGSVMKNLIKGENISLSLHRREELAGNWAHAFVTKYITEHGFTSSKTTNYQFSLYLYNETGEKISNLNTQIVEKFDDIVSGVSSEEIFNYVYAILFSEKYRAKYNDLLKRDFPRVPYPSSSVVFSELSKLGKGLRELHLLESSKLDSLSTTFSVEGNNLVEKIVYKDNKVYINEIQFFGNIPEVAWNFYIGGYQPAQKWLKDRKGKQLTSEDIEHYQKVISALVETEKVANEIDRVIEI